MSHRFLASMGAVAVVITVALLAAAPVAGQAQSVATGKTWTLPRTPDGQPDLQGVWDYRTITPLDLPTRKPRSLKRTKIDARIVI